MEAQKRAQDNPPFSATRERFEGLLGVVGSEEWLAMTHADMEGALMVAGRELMRTFYEELLAVRAAATVVEPVVGSDGVERTHVRSRVRRLTSVFGEVEARRDGYSARGTCSLFPVDGALNLPRESYSLGLRRMVAVEAAKVSYDEVAAAVAERTGVVVPKRQLEELVRRAAIDFGDFYEQRAPAANTPTGALLVLSTDGKGISMRRDDLREATRKAAERRQPKLEKRLCKGEKTATRRMAQVAAVYTIEPFVRTPEEIVQTLGPAPAEAPPQRRPPPLDKRVWASVAKDADAVIGEAFAEAERRDPERAKRWVILVDGGEHQLRCIRRLCKHKKLKVTIIVDIIHVIEYLWDAARVFHGEGTPEAEKYVSERLLRVLQGKASQVAGGMRRSATMQGLAAERRRPVDGCARYLLKYAKHLRYDEYLAAGYPIATGVIEGACRYLVKDRMDITGARWSLAGAEAVLRLRALRASGDFDDYWAFHVAREHERNHLSSYANQALPASQPASHGRSKPSLQVVS